MEQHRYRVDRDRRRGVSGTRVGSTARRRPPSVRRPPRRRTRLRVGRLLFVCLIAVGILVGVGWCGVSLLSAQVNRLVPLGNLLGGARARTGLPAGPLNFLIIGSNYRDDNPSNGERADTIMVLHVSASRDRAYLVSIPRDLYDTIKPYPPSGFAGSTEKIDAALNYGGMPLMAQTVADLTGLRFNGAVESRFDGFQRAVAVLGGVNMCVDEETTSVHIGHDASGKVVAPYTDTGAHPIPVPGVTPVVYHRGCQHLAPWQALDYVRQRELLPHGDYDRQRHQQQFIVAVLAQLTAVGTLRDPVKLARAVHDIGQSLTVDTDGAPLLDLVMALRNITPSAVVGLRTPSRPDPHPPYYIHGDPDMPQLFQALRDDSVAAFAAAHPELVNRLPG